MIPDQCRYQYLTALTGSCDELYHALDGGHRQAAWKAVRDALGWLHRIEELAKNDPGYFAQRGSSDAGKTMAGLIWVRTVVDHHGGEVLAIGLTTGATVTKFGSRHGGAIIRSAGGAIGPKTGLAETIVWPARTSLPPGQRERHQRDVLYDHHVAGRELLRPLRTRSPSSAGSERQPR
jgi:hypothetical protein